MSESGTPRGDGVMATESRANPNASPITRVDVTSTAVRPWRRWRSCATSSA